MKSIGWSVVIVTGVIFGSIHPILINLGKDENRKITFSSASVALSIELLKLLISGLLVLKDVVTHRNFFRPQYHVIPLYAVPAILYAVVNNLVTHAQAYMDPSSFQIMNNLKIVSIAVFYRLAINSHVSWRRWMSVALLFFAGVVNSIGGLRNREEEKQDGGGEVKGVYITMTGIYIMCIYCCVSGMAGVYTEVVLKKYKQTSISFQNSILYGFGVVINGLLFIGNNAYSKQTASVDLWVPEKGFFDGFTVYTWLIVVTQALNGIIISLIMKHLSNLTRLLMIGVSMVLTTLLSCLVFSYTVDWHFVAAFLIVMTALYLYYEDDGVAGSYVQGKSYSKRV